MRAVAKACVTFALLALVALGFSTTVRVCSPSDARAREIDRSDTGSPLVTAVMCSSELITEDSAAKRATELTAGRDIHDTLHNASQAGDENTPEDIEREALTLTNLSVWDAPDNTPSVYLSFMPIVTESFRGDVQYRKAVVEGEEVDVADVAPVLDEEHVRVECDGEDVQVASLLWYYAGYGDLGGADVKYMPMCLIRIARPDLAPGTHAIRVMIEDAGTGETGAGTATFTSGAGSSEL